MLEAALMQMDGIIAGKQLYFLKPIGTVLNDYHISRHTARAKEALCFRIPNGTKVNPRSPRPTARHSRDDWSRQEASLQVGHEHFWTGKTFFHICSQNILLPTPFGWKKNTLLVENILACWSSSGSQSNNSCCFKYRILRKQASGGGWDGFDWRNSSDEEQLHICIGIQGLSEISRIP